MVSKRKFKKNLHKLGWKTKKVAPSMPLSEYRFGAIHKFKRTYSSQLSLMDELKTGVLQWQLDLLPNYADFTALYDSYRIMGVKVKWIWNKNSAFNSTSVGAPGDGSFIPILYSVTDVDDGNAMNTIDEHLAYGNCKVRRLDKVCTDYVRPYNRIMVYNTAITTGYASKAGTWLDTSNTDIKYHGIKYAIDGTGAGGTGEDPIGKILLVQTFYVQCRGSK